MNLCAYIKAGKHADAVGYLFAHYPHEFALNSKIRVESINVK